MQLILLERVEGLGNVGSEVTVRAGYGRNFLIPQGKAIIATKANEMPRPVFPLVVLRLLAVELVSLVMIVVVSTNVVEVVLVNTVEDVVPVSVVKPLILIVTGSLTTRISPSVTMICTW